MEKSDYIFSYGTLRNLDVQNALFGRILSSVPDALTGYRLSQLQVSDPKVVELSGSEIHPVLEFTGNPQDLVEGAALTVTPADLHVADAYESLCYRRERATLQSGRTAWIYVRAVRE